MVQLPFAQVMGQGVRETKGSMIKDCFLILGMQPYLGFYVGKCPHAPKIYSWANQMFPYGEKKSRCIFILINWA